jgi:hypothetical protein
MANLWEGLPSYAYIVAFEKLLLYFVLMFNWAGIRYQSFMEIA